MSFLSDLLNAEPQHAAPVDKSQPYFAALGRFIVAYSVAEAQLHQVVRKLSGMKDEKARAVFGGARRTDLIDALRQLMRINKTSKAKKEDIEACIKQFNVLADCRHHLVHRLVDYKGMSLKVTNKLTSKTIVGIEEEEFTGVDLVHMTIDAWFISARLDRIRDPKIKKHEDRDWKRKLYEPWRYIPPKQDPQRATRRVAHALMPLQ